MDFLNDNHEVVLSTNGRFPFGGGGGVCGKWSLVSFF